MSMRTLKLAVPVVLASLALGACGSATDDEVDMTGKATAAITNVPSDVGCIAITVTGARTVDKKFDVATGASSILSLSGLPVGSVNFVGQAFSGACSGVVSSSVPTWVSDPVAATLISATNVNVTLPLRRNGKSTVSVDFVDDGADAGTSTCTTTICGGACVDLATNANNCGACGNVCPTGGVCTSGICGCPAGSVMCSGPTGPVCTNVASSPTNCGACGNVCGTGMACVSGMCTFAPSSCSDGIKNGTETGIDCGGGACPRCGTGRTCVTNSDCLSSICLGGVCG